MFLSSNPSINHEEVAALSWSEDWQEDRIVDYFDNLFSGSWTDEKRLRTLKKDGTYGEAHLWVRFWGAVRSRASELLERPAQPGVDYALTEVVRCKSRDEEGVEKAVSICVKNYLFRTFAQAKKLRVVVVLGDVAQKQLRSASVISEREDTSRKTTIEQITLPDNRQIWFAFLPHPNHRGVRGFSKCLTGEELDELQKALKD